MKLYYITNLLKRMLIVFIPLFFCIQGVSQNSHEYSSTNDRIKYYKDHLKLEKESVFKNMDWQFIGPTNVSGRMTDVEVVSPKGKNYTIYVAGATGGIWKTSNEGTTWEPIFEKAMTASIGDIA